LRFFYFAFSTTFGISGFLWKILLGEPKTIAGLKFRRRWLNHVPRRLGLRMREEGTPCRDTCLYVGNHITYIDPIVVLMYVDASVIAKAEISKWPLVGLGAAIGGTIFVKREQKSSRDAVAKAIREALENNMSILVFPEGTTSAGPATLPFRPRSFEAASLAGVPVQPIAISFESPEVPYIGDDTFLPHFFRLFTLKEIRGKIVFGPLLYGDNTCETAKAWIDNELTKDQLTTKFHECTQKA